MNHIGRPDETGIAMFFLASDDSSYATGVKLFVDGRQDNFEDSFSYFFSLFIKQNL